MIESIKPTAPVRTRRVQADKVDPNGVGEYHTKIDIVINGLTKALDRG